VAAEEVSMGSTGVPRTSVLALAIAAALAGCASDTETARRIDASTTIATADGARPDALSRPLGIDGSLGEAAEGGASSTSTLDSGPTGVGADAVCPSEPAPGAPCARLGAICSWGDETFLGCREGAQCNGEQLVPVLLGTCVETSPIACPPEPIEGAACGTAWDECRAGDRRCVCVPCLGRSCASGGRAEFVCASPTAEPGCPGEMPNLGTPCSSDALRCHYGHCDIGNVIVTECAGEIWRQYPGAVSCL
jgi:hypothetical protein